MYIYQKILNKLSDIFWSIRAIECKLDEIVVVPTYYGIVTEPPVAPPTGSDPVVVLDTTTGILYYWDGASWSASSSGGFFLSDVASGATVQNANNNDFSLEGVDHLNIDSLTALIQGSEYIQLQTSSAGNTILLDDDTGIRISSEADIRLASATSQYNFLTPVGALSLPTQDNAVLSVLGVNTTTGRVYTRTVASIVGTSDTNFATTNLTLTGDRVHTGSNTRSLTIQNLTAFAVNTGAGNQSITLDNTGNGILVNSDASINLYTDYGGGVNGGVGVTGGFVSISSNSATDLSGINLSPGLLGLQFRDSQGYYNFDATGGSALPGLDDVGEAFEGLSDRMLTVDANGRILRKALPTASANFANTDLTFTTSRSHDLSGNDLEFINGHNFKTNVTNNIEIKVNAGGGVVGEFQGGIGYSYIAGGDGIDTASIIADGANGVGLYSSNFKYLINGLVEYVDDTAAGVGGLTAGRLYRTALGIVMVKL